MINPYKPPEAEVRDIKLAGAGPGIRAKLLYGVLVPLFATFVLVDLPSLRETVDGALLAIVAGLTLTAIASLAHEFVTLRPSRPSVSFSIVLTALIVAFTFFLVIGNDRGLIAFPRFYVLAPYLMLCACALGFSVWAEARRGVYVYCDARGHCFLPRSGP